MIPTAQMLDNEKYFKIHNLQRWTDYQYPHLYWQKCPRCRYIRLRKHKKSLCVDIKSGNFQCNQCNSSGDKFGFKYFVYYQKNGTYIFAQYFTNPMPSYKEYKKEAGILETQYDMSLAIT